MRCNGSGFASSTLDHRRLAVDLAEVVLKWELQRIRDHDQDDNVRSIEHGLVKPCTVFVSQIKQEPDAGKPIDKQHIDVVVNLLLRLACQGSTDKDKRTLLVSTSSAGLSAPQVKSFRRCVQLLKTAPEARQQCEPKVPWLDKVFASADSNAGACTNACTALELLYEELETLYSSVSKYVFEGLANHEKCEWKRERRGATRPLMMLKACCSSSPSYIDRVLTPLMRVLQRMVRDHVASTPDAATSDLLILALDLLKARVAVMPVEIRKPSLVLVGLIKSADARHAVIKAITRMVEEWMKFRPTTALGVAAAPSLREKSILLVKLMQYVEKRFPDDPELNAQFLELVNYVYRDDTLKTSELSKLEPAFLAGLRCSTTYSSQVFSVRLKCADAYTIDLYSNSHKQQNLLPNITAVINWGDSENANLLVTCSVKEESSDGFNDSLDMDKDDVMDMDLDSNSNQKDDLNKQVPNRQKALNQIISKQCEFLELARRAHGTVDYGGNFATWTTPWHTPLG
ncbi:hypothetical protein EVAR_95223_1 [Eumeta japonica]|uniref:Uncharacterized protein n=1 Tax=Eumeta variegata TaxID=151549 RepID=A0A4C2A184_EUMVA|nr:hypothetical protein EVAR_95223_1 [Eumeta japonica]